MSSSLLLGAVVPYDLRHSFRSLPIQEGQSVVEVAAQAGHAASMTLNTYAHVFEELKGGARLDAEAQIKAARAAHVPVSYPKDGGSDLSAQQKPANTHWAILDSNQGPLPYQRSALTD